MAKRSRIWEKRNLNCGQLLIAAAMALSLSLTAIAQDQSAPQAVPGAAPLDQAPAQTTTVVSPTSETEVKGSAPLRVLVGKSLLINTTERLKRISVTDSSIADPASYLPNSDSGAWPCCRGSIIVDLG